MGSTMPWGALALCAHTVHTGCASIMVATPITRDFHQRSEYVDRACHGGLRKQHYRRCWSIRMDLAMLVNLHYRHCWSICMDCVKHSRHAPAHLGPLPGFLAPLKGLNCPCRWALLIASFRQRHMGHAAEPVLISRRIIKRKTT